MVQHVLFECKFGLDESLYNSKEKWNHDKYRCECKKLGDWGSWKIDYMWNPSACDCERNKTCKIYKYLDIKNCLCKKSLILILVLEGEDKISNATEMSLDDKRKHAKK